MARVYRRDSKGRFVAGSLGGRLRTDLRRFKRGFTRRGPQMTLTNKPVSKLRVNEYVMRNGQPYGLVRKTRYSNKRRNYGYLAHAPGQRPYR